MKDPIVLDFETEAVDDMSKRPPTPVGLAVRWSRSHPSHYMAWGHPSENNCTAEKARDVLLAAWRDPRPKLFHNAKFDMAVAKAHFGLPVLDPRDFEDTMFLAYLCDPHSRSNGLKDLAQDLLGWEPEERDEVHDWLYERRRELMATYGGVLNTARTGPSSTGAWICRAPGGLVGRYARGDVDRTSALFDHLMPIVHENGMGPAYMREKRVLPIFMENEDRGIRVDVQGLERDISVYAAAKERAEGWLRKRLGAPDLNLDADREVADALSSAGIVDDDKWTLTETGLRSVSKKNLKPSMYNDPLVASAFGYRNRLVTCLETFMCAWVAQAAARGDGTVSPSWNQTRGGDGGTRTGRPSTSNPNFLNVSKSFEGRGDGYTHPAALDVPPLPLVRNYVLPDEGGVFLHRDFDGQELRIYAHFEGGDLFSRYCANPRFKPHDYIKGIVEELAKRPFDKTTVKNINFGKIYGAGIPRIMELLDCGRTEAEQFNRIHDRAMPDMQLVKEEIKRIVGRGLPIRTFGGRLYFPEEPKLVNGKMRDFIYKLLNYLVQGSAADCTKEALIRWYTHPKRDPEDRFLVTVYDEINISAPRRRFVEAMGVLRECMEGIELDVPMLSAPRVGLTWGGAKGPADGEDESAFLRRMAEAL